MTVETAADRAAMLAPFGVPATYTLAGGGSADLVGIADRAFVERASAGSGSGVETREAVLTVAEDDLPAGAAGLSGDTVTLAGATWHVRSIEPDGTGFAQVALERAD